MERMIFYYTYIHILASHSDDVLLVEYFISKPLYFIHSNTDTFSHFIISEIEICLTISVARKHSLTVFFFLGSMIYIK